MSATYHVMVITETNVQYEAFSSRDELIGFLKTLPAWGGQVFAFKGSKLGITIGNFHYLQEGEKTFPLFDPPSPGPVSESGNFDPEEAQPDSEYINTTDSLPKE